MAADCLFCRMASGEIAAPRVAENEHAFAIRDIAPRAPVHVLVVPRRHFDALRSVRDEDAPIVADALLLAARVAAEQGLLDGGYRVITNDGPE